MDMSWRSKRVYFFLVLILLLGTFLRLYQLGEKSLWTDELVVMENAAQIVGIKSFLEHTRGDDLPRFYSLLFKFWMHFGKSEFTMRILSVIFGCLSILVVYALSRLFFVTKTSLCAAFLTAVSPFLLLYDREIRMYSLFALFSLLSAYLFIRSLRENKKTLWGLYILVNVLNIYTHYYAFLVLGVQWIFVIVRFRDYKRMFTPWIAANSIIALTFAVRLPAFIQDVAYHAPWALPRERFPFIFGKHVVEFFYIFFSFSAGQTILPWNPVAALICLAVLASFVFAMRKGVLFSQAALYLVLLVFVPVTIGIVFRISMPRYFIFAAPILFIFIARGFWLLPKKAMVAVALIIVTGWSYGIANYYQNKQFHIMAHVDPWREVGRFLEQNVTEEAEIVVIGIGVVPLRHYYRESLSGFSGEDLIARVRELDGAGVDKIWLVYTYQEEYKNWLVSRDILSPHYRLSMEKAWVDDPHFALKKKLFRRNFAPYRIAAALYERKQ
jgi:4-amino-4-deoxy-L-arabinose transferase-like glycosyltransferase